MRRKLIGIYLVFIFISSSMSTMFVLADDQEPQITDQTGDAFGYIDIVDIEFFEKEEAPEYLYVSMQINDPSFTTFQQTFAVFWKLNDIEYSCSLHRGFSLKYWDRYTAGISRTRDHNDINGTYNMQTGVITWKVPKEFIGDPEKGDVLYDTWSNAFRRLGFIGRIGFTRYILDAVILKVFNNKMWDYAPGEDSYGDNYIIKY